MAPLRVDVARSVPTYKIRKRSAQILSTGPLRPALRFRQKGSTIRLNVLRTHCRLNLWHRIFFGSARNINGKLSERPSFISKNLHTSMRSQEPGSSRGQFMRLVCKKERK
ncbi:hypothetical protein NBO_327g0002 [Nosema bombycis CQ1]|uniref:Uncharacterized protein n=1 Tax=Nosema bombycis (strain CQ1 / CVCC 102059) TaxID=578461 RepID=R0MFL7_NOSB1|nr:hypothetical protein NBO_327g0002 [Nosema bombycis CQ1]|eukprot:EOB12905.1 hypothetical protein NBO_327g0002 [Nosema bombycis CQ1]